VSKSPPGYAFNLFFIGGSYALRASSDFPPQFQRPALTDVMTRAKHFIFAGIGAANLVPDLLHVPCGPEMVMK
jgi:hypothetical protein